MKKNESTLPDAATASLETIAAKLAAEQAQPAPQAGISIPAVTEMPPSGAQAPQADQSYQPPTYQQPAYQAPAVEVQKKPGILRKLASMLTITVAALIGAFIWGGSGPSTANISTGGTIENAGWWSNYSFARDGNKTIQLDTSRNTTKPVSLIDSKNRVYAPTGNGNWRRL